MCKISYRSHFHTFVLTNVPTGSEIKILTIPRSKFSSDNVQFTSTYGRNTTSYVHSNRRYRPGAEKSNIPHAGSTAIEHRTNVDVLAADGTGHKVHREFLLFILFSYFS